MDNSIGNVISNIEKLSNTDNFSLSGHRATSMKYVILKIQWLFKNAIRKFIFTRIKN